MVSTTKAVHLPARRLIQDEDEAQGIGEAAALELAGLEALVTLKGDIVRIKTPGAGTDNAWKGEMYGVRFVEGIGFTNDRELAEKIIREFPDYVLEA